MSFISMVWEPLMQTVELAYWVAPQWKHSSASLRCCFVPELTGGLGFLHERGGRQAFYCFHHMEADEGVSTAYCSPTPIPERASFTPLRYCSPGPTETFFRRWGQVRGLIIAPFRRGGGRVSSVKWAHSACSLLLVWRQTTHAMADLG